MADDNMTDKAKKKGKKNKEKKMADMVLTSTENG